jgi:hypothetical protein
MSSRPKLKFLPGLIACILPLTLQPTCFFLLITSLGGIESLSLTLGMAGPAIHRVIALTVVCTLGLAGVLFFLGGGRKVPLVAPVVIAAVPWVMGVLAALTGASNTLEAVANVDPEDQLTLLSVGTGELICARLLGAWASATLMLAVAGGCFIAGGVRRLGSAPELGGPTQEAGGSAADAVEGGNQLLEGVVPLLLALVGFLVAAESTELSKGLVAVGSVNPADKSTILVSLAEELRPNRLLRLGALGVLVLAGFTLGVRRLMQRPRSMLALASLVALFPVAAGVLWADGRPLARMTAAVEKISPVVPGLAEVRLLPFGREVGIYSVEVIASPRGLQWPDGKGVEWGAGDEALTDFLERARGNLPEEDRPAKGGLMDKLFRGSMPRSHLTLAVDARLSVVELRRLLDLCTQVGLDTLYLVGTRGPDGAGVERVREVLEEAPPFIRSLVLALESGAGMVTVYLPSILHQVPYESASVGAGGIAGQEALASSEPAPSDSTLYLTITEQAALEDVALAVRKAHARGFQVVLSSQPPPSPPPPPQP